MSETRAPDAPETQPAEPTATEEFREGITHLLTAARKVASQVEPQVNRSLEDAEQALQRLGREGEAAVGDVTREVASFAARLAEKLRDVADRADRTGRTDRTPPDGQG